MISMKERIKKELPSWATDLYTICHYNLKIARDYLSIRRECLKRHYRHDKIRIIFMVQRTEVFNSVRTVYESAIQDERCEVYLLPLPRCGNKGEGVYWDTYDSVAQFCKKLGSGIVIESFDFEGKKFCDLSQIEPDYVFLNVPYTEHYPSVYSIKELASLATVCYVPYGYSMMENHLPSIYFSRDFYSGVAFDFTSSELEYSFAKKYFRLSELLTKQRLYQIGFARFDLIEKCEKKKPTVLWLPRWTTGNGNPGETEESSFLPFYKDFLEFAHQNPQTDFIIRPHPLMFENFKKMGVMLESEMDEFKNVVEKMDNVSIDTSDDYLGSINQATILLSDFSSLLAEYYITARPIIYFGSLKDFSEYEKNMMQSFYTVRTWSETKIYLKQLLVGVDPKKEQREASVKQFTDKISDNIGRTILDIIISDYRAKHD